MNDKLDFLRNRGVDVDTAVENMIDAETYNEMLDDYYEGLMEDFNTLQGYKNANDIQNYAIQVHAMKSNARSFGFMKLGEIAYNHEMAAKGSDVNFINEHFEELKANVDEVYNMITEYKSL